MTISSRAQYEEQVRIADTNQKFVEKIASPVDSAGMMKAAGDLIEDHIREASFLSNILVPKAVAVGDPNMKRSMKTDSFVYVVDVTPNSHALTVSLRSEGGTSWISAPRFEVPFFTIGTKRHEAIMEELEAYPYPIADYIKSHFTSDMGEIVDRWGMLHFETATQYVQQSVLGLTLGAAMANNKAFTAYNVNQGLVTEVGKCKGHDVLANATSSTSNGVAEDLSYPIQKDDLTKLFKLFIGTGRSRFGHLQCAQVLMNDYDFENINDWVLSDLGHKLVEETTVNGFKPNTLIGRKFVRTLKVDIVRPGCLFGFAEQKYLGGFLKKGDIKFWAKREYNKISMQAYMELALYVGNVAGVRKLELFAGSADNLSSGDNSTYKVDYLPRAEADLRPTNNLVADGGNIPVVSSF